MRSLADIVDPQGADPEDDGELTVEKALRDFARAYEAQREMMKQEKQDFEFALGKQWEEKDVKDLSDVGVRALTINKIATHIQLLRGLEAQNRSDFRAYPEGEEDTLEAEIVTRLMKNAVKVSDLGFKISEMFEAGNACGRSYLEPWLKYPYEARQDQTIDLTASLCWRHVFGSRVFPDPMAQEYDYSDGRFWCKYTCDVSKDELKSMFPDKAAAIDKIKNGKIDVDEYSPMRDAGGTEVQKKGYEEESGGKTPWIPKGGLDLLDYYYTKYIPHFYVADFKRANADGSLGMIREVKSKRAGLAFVKQATARDKDPKRPSAKFIERLQPELWVGFIVGGEDDFLAHGPAWCFPNWKEVPLFGYQCFWMPAPLDYKDRHYTVQGITRRVKDLNRELNKRRTQELRHLNSSANSGWIAPEGAYINKEEWGKFGATPGVALEYDAEKGEPKKIIPTPLSAGHSQMAQEHQTDMREVLGVNPETLAIEADQISGRAIAQRLKQGLVMVQGIFDNLGRTRWKIGRFILAVLPELYDVTKAMRVLGEAFLSQNFQSPVTDPATGQPVVDPMSGQPATQYDPKLAQATIQKILQDTAKGVFDVALGENISEETVNIGNYMELKDMVSSGIPIPPEVLVEQSSLSDSTKKRIIASVNSQAMAAQPPKAPKR